MKIVKRIKNTKSVGLDDISSRVLKLATDALTIPIDSIINNIIKQNIFPEELKHAKVVPVYKKGAVDDPHNYRRLYVFEKHISNQLQEFFNNTNILHSTHSGFRKGHSCQTTLLHLVNKWATEIDKGNMVGTLLLDLSKAFDFVFKKYYLNLILKKLAIYHFSIDIQ